MTTAARFVLCAALAAGSSPALAQNRGPKGQGGIVLRDDAPVYVRSKGDAIEAKLKRGDAVAGFTSDLTPSYLFDEVNGRIHVLYFRGAQKGMSLTAWMDPKDISRFTYDGSCGAYGTPLTAKGFSQRWNACFEEGRDNKLDVLRPRFEEEDARKAVAPAPTPAPTAAPEAPPASAPPSLH